MAPPVQNLMVLLIQLNEWHSKNRLKRKLINMKIENTYTLK